MPAERVEVRGSERTPLPYSSQVGTPNPFDLVNVTIILRRKTGELPEPGTERVSREDFASRFGADPADVAKIQAFAAEFDLTVGNIDLARRSILLVGTVANMNEAFGTQLRIFQSPEGSYRGRTGMLFVPQAVAESIIAVLGLDERPTARTRFRRLILGPRAAGDTSYTPPAVAALYDYPSTGGGAGQTVGIIELGGGYTQADLTTYFKSLNLAVPNVTAVGVDNAANQPAGDPNSADGEVLLDIEVIGAIAPKANIAVYFGPNTDQGFLDAITTAVHDTVRKPSVVSISWGGPESSWTQQALTSYDQAFQDAALLGVTICVASGDDGSADGTTDGAAHVDFPASSPNVLACGGTRLESSGGAITKEVVWNEGAGNGAGGGGVSANFPLPSYQASAGVPPSVNPGSFVGRGVPDVSGDADPATGYQIFVDGHSAVFGGTSAVAPLWAALVALMNEHLGKSLGFVNPALYALKSQTAFHDIVSGNNGAYTAGPGWDACTGLGSPDGVALQTALGVKPTKKHHPHHSRSTE